MKAYSPNECSKCLHEHLMIETNKVNHHVLLVTCDSMEKKPY